MHPVLARQLERLELGAMTHPSDADWARILEVIDSTYTEADRTRYRLERSLDLSSEESRQHHRRQAALSACAQALLMEETSNPEQRALDVIRDGLEVAGVWLTTHDGSGDPRIVASSGTVDCDAALASVPTTPARGSGNDDRPREESVARDLRIPIVVHGRWQGTLAVCSESGHIRFGTPARDLLETAATMIGAHWARQDATVRLERLVTAKDQFVASVSHELRTPLTGVVGFAQELQTNWHIFDTKEIRELIDLIVEQSEDVAHLVEDLLVVARSDIGRLRLHPENVDLRQQIKAVCRRFVTSHPERISFEGHGIAHADPNRVRQIVRNLVTNAMRYGGHRVRVRIARMDGCVDLEVRDDGDGVPDSAIDRIFEAFESAHEVPTQPNSVGLGLWVARTLAEAMGGSLGHRREHGETVFTLSLPSSHPLDEAADTRATVSGVPGD